MTGHLHAWTRLRLENADHVIAELCAHMLEHNAEHMRDGSTSIIRLSGSRARIAREGADIVISVVAPDLQGLYFMRLAIASHIVEFAVGQALAIRWEGDGAEITRPPNFSLLRVAGIANLTPKMRRITFESADTDRFLPLDALHLNLLLQREGSSDPQWPEVGPDGIIRWSDLSRRPVMRKYTVRSIDATSGRLAIDFVRHADAGPGSEFAERAKAGDVIGALGPGGGGLVAADWYLLAGDETALPAIARMAENLPLGSRAVILLEVEDEGEIQPLSPSVPAEIRWLCRRQTDAAPGVLLMRAIRDLEFPSDGERIYAWAASEFEAFRQIREHFRRERKLTKTEHLVVSYWRKGKSEDQMGALRRSR
jgi:NADPH-dependent ferric siderophore reductase